MNIPPKYEDVVAQLETERARVTDYIAQRAQTELLLEATLGREAALREELDLLKPTFESTFDSAQRDRAERDALQQRLTVAEQRVGNLKSLLRESLEESKEGDDYIDRVIAALKELSHDQ